MIQDLTERKTAEERIRRLALHDPLTGLPNRALLLDRLGQALARAHREGGMVAVIVLDLDGMKEINDVLGHPAGDQLLCRVGSRVTAAIRSSDTMARIGGDEFALVQQLLRHPADATTLAAKILSTFAAPFNLDGHEVQASTSIGIALYPQDGQSRARCSRTPISRSTVRRPLAATAIACSNRVWTRQRPTRRPRLEHGAAAGRCSAASSSCTISCSWSSRPGAFTGAEALVRWNHPQRGLVMPDEFVPVAEANGLIRPLGIWVLNEACRQGRGLARSKAGRWPWPSISRPCNCATPRCKERSIRH